MKVLLINGSPHEKGCTYTALSEIAGVLNENGIDTEIFQVGSDPIRGCVGCGGCAGKNRCVFQDQVNVALDKAAEADGFIFGSPVHYASVGCFLQAKKTWFISPEPPLSAAAVQDPPQPLTS